MPARGPGALLVALEDPTLEVAAGGTASLSTRISNTTGERVAARVRVTGRAAGWLRVDEGAEGLDVPADGTATVTVTAHPPDAAREGQLVPFAVHVDGSDGGTASATGLVVVGVRQRLEVTMSPTTATTRRTATLTIDLRTTGRGTVVAWRATSASAGLRLTGGGAPTVEVLPDRPAQVRLTARTRRPVLLAPTRHDVTVAWESLDDADAQGTTRATVRQVPLLPLPATAALLAIALLAVVVGARALQGRELNPLSDLRGGSTAATDTAAPGTVSMPYVLLGALAQGTDPDATRKQADERAAALDAAGIPDVRVVAGADLPDARPGAPAFWVLVRDGFEDLAAAQEFCDQHDGTAGAACRPSG